MHQGFRPRALKSIRPPVGGMFNPPDTFGEEEQIALAVDQRGKRRVVGRG